MQIFKFDLEGHIIIDSGLSKFQASKASLQFSVEKEKSYVRYCYKPGDANAWVAVGTLLLGNKSTSFPLWKKTHNVFQVVI